MADVDWSSLSTSYGDATGVPGFLRALYDPDETVRDAALSDLWCLCHQETVYDGSAAAVPLLVRAAHDAALSPAQRHQLLGLVVCIGRGEDTCWEGYTPWDVVVACADAVAAELPGIVSWAKRGSAEARRWSVVLAAYFPDEFRRTGTDVTSLLSDPDAPIALLAKSLVDGEVPKAEAIRAAAADDEDTLDWLDTGMAGMSDARKARQVVLDLIEKQAVA